MGEGRGATGKWCGTVGQRVLTLSISFGPSERFLDTVMKEALWKELKDGEVALWVFRRSMPQV